MQACVVASIIVAAFAVSCRLERFFDFRAFYCAGQVERLGADPYRAHPLYECEHKPEAGEASPIYPAVTVPAPFPGPVLLIFAALSVLPFALAQYIWVGAAAIALGFAGVLVARSTQTPLVANAIVLGFPAVVVALPLGQLTPFILLAVAGCCTLLQSGRPRCAALAALGALLDPQVGLALVLGVFVGVRTARGVLIAGIAVLSVLGIGAPGLDREWEYLFAVVPAHALANVADSGQFSATNFAFVAGIRPSLALTLGSLWYLGALGVGVLVAFRMRSRQGVAAIAYVPVAFAVFGGLYTHLQQLALAVPAFMLLYSASTGRQRVLCGAGAYFAAIPWLVLMLSPWLYLAPAALAVVFANEMEFARQSRLLAVASNLTIAGASITGFWRHPTHVVVLPHMPGNPLAEVSWQSFMLAKNVPPEPWYMFAKAPTAIAFLVLLAMLANAAFRRGPKVAAGVWGLRRD